LEKGKSRRWRKGAVGDLARCYGVNGALQAVEEITNGIEQQGWAVVAGCLAKEASLRLIQECEESCKNGDFRRAGVGRGKALEVREDIRRDQVKWLEPGDGAVEQGSYLAWLENLRLALNQRFFLGLFEFEGHFAIYPEGAFYKPHLDRHAGTSDRIVTVILYLNPSFLRRSWKAYETLGGFPKALPYHSLFAQVCCAGKAAFQSMPSRW
jgi:Rps23 Pro-64 3,4-dihydroxylase Tpa1-like proline 4-hydroxylase